MNENTQLATEQREAAKELAEALSGGRFVLFRQRIEPLVAGSTEPGFQEILIRFLDEDERFLHPGQFFATLERCGLMFTLDCWVVNAVINWLTDRKRTVNGDDVPCCSVNLSAESIANPELLRFVSERLQVPTIPTGRIVFEIPETDAAVHAIALMDLISQLAPTGCRFAVAGYSGKHVTPALLQALGIEFVKIDGVIVQNLHRDRMSFAMADEISRSCRDKGIRTIGQFVELPETVQKLRDLGVDYVQGYGIAVPEPLD